ncbi:bifunctional 2',3'-cyclic-nucleotide 2'-phosphodiesterase/3'-nucleotidase [Leeia aquatica]|uniref:Bifunctional 2',3'-cyclic-nucleotide 2'-phosphodiesterase/3'-nucleotidase n=1 Tax=Leeia aquatica TaxID=2725557 RepID=A0A847SB22_9NEIS|nr:bifunctional 2',3'-cyclic-nucleotide 2'-phosphodiesterase/3'-nucleotidase [Leeia aquatica]NLR74529.1 bifunctional 2',3'-cyclic-nucleotide 2'-phosphodiesterase/3'-nucleotidase [Leeia aquatica]
MQKTLLAFAVSVALVGNSHAAEVRLRILETTDIHMNLLNYDYYQDRSTDEYGLAKTISLIKAARSESKNSLLFDNGDLLQGNPLGDLVAKIKPLKAGETHPAYKVMNTLQYDAGNIGNHEFNYGLPFLKQSLATARFPYVNANVYLDDKDGKNERHAFTPYLLLDRKVVDETGQSHTLKVGVIGFVPPQIMSWDKANLEGKVVAKDIIKTAQRYVPEMRAKGAQLIIAIPHSGFEKGELGDLAENAVAGLANVPGVDAILFGHAHAEFPSKAFASHPKVNLEQGTINGIPSVMPGRWGDHLGVIDLKLDNQSGPWKVVDSKASIRPIFDRANKKPLVDADPAVAQLIGHEHADTLSYVRGKVSESSAPIYSYFAQVADDSSVQVVSNAQIAFVRTAVQGTAYEKYPILSAAAPFKAGGRQGWSYYTDIPAGNIAIKNVADLYIYPNTLKAVLLNGAEVREWLEMSAGQFNQIDPKGAAEQSLINDNFRSYNFDTIDGVNYDIDVTQPARYALDGKLQNVEAHRIHNLSFNGKPIDEQARFLVVTNNYRAFGGGNFPGVNGSKVVVDSPDENREAVVQYLTSIPKLNLSADKNWRILPVAGVKLRFLSATAASKYLSNHPGIRQVKDNGDGSALYELVN